MRRLNTCSLLAGFFTGITIMAAEQPRSAPADDLTNGTSAVAAKDGTRSLLLNFRSAPLNQVLNYLSDSAGFVINRATDVQGTVDMWSKEPLTKAEAVDLLDSALRKNGCTAIRNGRILTIVSLQDAKTADLKVVSGNDPDAVEKSDEVVTQIIPVRYASASELANNLQPLLPASASFSVNQSANSIILIDTKTDIRRMLRIISALDTSIAQVSSIKIFPLRYADAKELAAVLQQLFSPQGSSQSGGRLNMRAQLFNLPGGDGFGPPGPPEPVSGSTGSDGSGGSVAASKIVAVADDRSNTLIVSADSFFLPTVARLVQQLDRQVNAIAELRIFRLRNAEPAEVADQLSQLFPDDSGSSAGQNPMVFGFGEPPPPGADLSGTGTSDVQSNSSDRKMKQGRVLAVADPRTTSLLVSAATTLMPQIAKIIEQLDASSARKEIVKVYDLQNSDPQDVDQALQDLFNRTITMQNNNNRNSLLGQNNPLTARQTQQQSSTKTGTGGSGTSTGL
jgi:general secretion pathway protein D